MKHEPLWFFFPEMEEITSERWVICLTERVVVVRGFGHAKTRYGKIKCTRERGHMVPLRYQDQDFAGLRRLRKRIRKYIEARSKEFTIQIEKAAANNLEIPPDPDFKTEKKKEKQAA